MDAKAAPSQLDVLVATQVMGHSVSQSNGEYLESAEGKLRPLPCYSSDIAAAWEVAKKMAITLLPVEHDAWFAFVGPHGQWKSPEELVQVLQNHEFENSGASVSPSAPLAICQAALNALEKRKLAGNQQQQHQQQDPRLNLADIRSLKH